MLTPIVLSQRVLERHGRVAGEVKGRAVDHRGELRLDLNIDVGRQAGNKRHADFELRDGVLGLFRAVVEIDFAVDDFNVIEGEARRRPRRAAGEFFD